MVQIPVSARPPPIITTRKEDATVEISTAAERERTEIDQGNLTNG